MQDLDGEAGVRDGEAAGRVVSSDTEELIVVDEHDTEIGSLAKGACHDGRGVLHRAFSLFVVNPAGEILLQQRSAHKRLWPGYWSNSCCSHPRRGEPIEAAVERRAEQELGLVCDPRFLYKFRYQASFGDLGAENEYCHVFAARSADEPRVNPTEIAHWAFVQPDALSGALDATPQRYTPWLRLEWQRLQADYRGMLPYF